MMCACSSLLERSQPVVGFCFSFPVQQTSVSSGKLLRWTKGYTNPGAVGSDPAKLLGDAFRRRVCPTYAQSAFVWQRDTCSSHPGHLHHSSSMQGQVLGSRLDDTLLSMLQCAVQGIQANVGALINDTVGVLAAVRYIDGTDTIASVIMGTGKPLRYLGGCTCNHAIKPSSLCHATGRGMVTGLHFTPRRDRGSRVR